MNELTNTFVSVLDCDAERQLIEQLLGFLNHRRLCPTELIAAARAHFPQRFFRPFLE